MQIPLKPGAVLDSKGRYRCHESYPPQAAWGAKDLDVQKSSPLQVVAVG